MQSHHSSNERKRYLFFISQDYSFPILRPLQDAIQKKGDIVKWFLYGDEIHINHLHHDEYRIHTIDDVIDFSPHAVFVPGNVVPSFIPGLKVQIFHGLPSTKAKKNGQLYHYIIRGMFDLYCTQGKNSSKQFKLLSKKYNFFTIKETGWCKLDPLFPLINRKKDTIKTIFFASTFSPRFSKAKILYPFIVHMIQKYNYKWYITLHPKMDDKIVKLYKSIVNENVTFIEAIDTIESFKKSDIMLCDTSSIIYEFLTQGKPVITFQTQKEEASLINITDINKLEKSILNTLENNDRNHKNIIQHVKNFHHYTDGKSSQRVLNIVEEMLECKHLPSKKKPLNIIRNLKLRKELGFWKL